jgi:hypothetical protein
MRSSDHGSIFSLGEHWKYIRWMSGDRVLTSTKPRSCIA